MQTVTLPSQDEPAGVIPCCPPRVCVNGVRRRDLQVRTWRLEPAPDFGEVQLTMQDSASEVRPPGLAAIGSLPEVGSDVLVRPAWEFGAAEFRGFVARHDVSADAIDAKSIAVVRHQLVAKTASPLLGRWELDDGAVVWTRRRTVRFNVSSRTRMSPARCDFGLRRAPVFDASDTARSWTVGSTVAYLIAAHLPAGVEAPTAEELHRLAGDVDLGEYEADDTSLADLLVTIAGRAGLRIRSARNGLGLVVYRPGCAGRRRRLLVQTDGETLSTVRNNLTAIALSLGRRPARRPIRVLGGRKRYEATFTLQPGWDASLETTRWRDFLRGESSAGNERRWVYRRWVLNEHGRYDDVPPGDLPGLLGEDFQIHRARAFLACVSTDAEGNGYGVIVEYRVSPSASWRRWAGPVWVARDECAVVLDGDALPGDYFAAVAAGQAELRVTASVESDQRIEFSLPGDPGWSEDVRDLSSRASWLAVHPASVFHTGGLLSTVVRDDTSRLAAHARSVAEANRGGSEVTVDLAWVDPSCHVGDVVERLDGPDVELSSRPDCTLSVRSVRHEFERTQTTQLVLEG